MEDVQNDSQQPAGTEDNMNYFGGDGGNKETQKRREREAKGSLGERIKAYFAKKKVAQEAKQAEKTDAQTGEMGKKLNKRTARKVALISFAGIIVLAAGIFAFLHLIPEEYLNDGSITIGGITITEEDIEAYVAALQERMNANPDVDFGDMTLYEVAEADLIMNAILRYYAGPTQCDIGIAAEDILVGTREHLTDAMSVDTEYGVFSTSNFRRVRAENDIYKTHLQRCLIVARDIFAVAITYSATHFDFEDNLEAAEQLFLDSKARLERDFLPMFEEGWDSSDIARMTDLDFYNSGLGGHPSWVEDWPPVASFLHIVTMGEGFNDHPDVEYPEIFGEVFSLTDVAMGMTEVGEHTDVIVGNNGEIVILRLDKVVGRYDTWEDLLDKYRAQRRNLLGRVYDVLGRLVDNVATLAMSRISGDLVAARQTLCQVGASNTTKVLRFNVEFVDETGLPVNVPAPGAELRVRYIVDPIHNHLYVGCELPFRSSGSTITGAIYNCVSGHMTAILTVPDGFVINRVVHNAYAAEFGGGMGGDPWGFRLTHGWQLPGDNTASFEMHSVTNLNNGTITRHLRLEVRSGWEFSPTSTVTVAGAGSVTARGGETRTLSVPMTSGQSSAEANALLASALSRSITWRHRVYRADDGTEPQTTGWRLHNNSAVIAAPPSDNGSVRLPTPTGGRFEDVAGTANWSTPDAATGPFCQSITVTPASGRGEAVPGQGNSVTATTCVVLEPPREPVCEDRVEQIRDTCGITGERIITTCRRWYHDGSMQELTNVRLEGDIVAADIGNFERTDHDRTPEYWWSSWRAAGHWRGCSCGYDCWNPRCTWVHNPRATTDNATAVAFRGRFSEQRGTTGGRSWARGSNTPGTTTQLGNQAAEGWNVTSQLFGGALYVRPTDQIQFCHGSYRGAQQVYHTGGYVSARRGTAQPFNYSQRVGGDTRVFSTPQTSGTWPVSFSPNPRVFPNSRGELQILSPQPLVRAEVHGRDVGQTFTQNIAFNFTEASTREHTEFNEVRRTGTFPCRDTRPDESSISGSHSAASAHTGLGCPPQFSYWQYRSTRLNAPSGSGQSEDAVIRVPYNYEIYVRVDQEVESRTAGPDSVRIAPPGAAWDIDVEFRVDTTENEHLRRQGHDGYDYATHTKDTQWRLVKAILPPRGNRVGYLTVRNTGSDVNTTEPCGHLTNMLGAGSNCGVAVHEGGELLQGSGVFNHPSAPSGRFSLNGSTEDVLPNTRGFFVDDVEPGTTICYMFSVFPASGDDRQSGHSYLENTHPGDSWAHSQARCVVTAKRPLATVQGAGLFTPGGISVNQTTKTPCFSRPAYVGIHGAMVDYCWDPVVGSGSRSVFGSWSEYEIVSGHGPSPGAMASGAGFGYTPIPRTQPPLIIGFNTHFWPSYAWHPGSATIGLNFAENPGRADFPTRRGGAGTIGHDRASIEHNHLTITNRGGFGVYEPPVRHHNIERLIQRISELQTIHDENDNATHVIERSCNFGNVAPGRSILCLSDTAVTITNNIVAGGYGTFTNIADLPQVIIMAPTIIINPNVTRVDAWLVTAQRQDLVGADIGVGDVWELAQEIDGRTGGHVHTCGSRTAITSVSA